jgi:hypothetical protein
LAERGSVIDGFWLLAVLAHYPTPRVTEERYQVVQEKLDKLDNLKKNAMDVEAIGFGVNLTTEFEKNSLLDELSNLSNFTQSVQPEEDAALDNLFNESSNLDEPTPVEATTPASSVENTSEATEVEVMEYRF